MHACATHQPRHTQEPQASGADMGLFAVARGGVEPPTFRFSVGRSYQLSYLALTSRATPTGLEPATSAVTGRRANQLRYGASCEVMRIPNGIRTRATAVKGRGPRPLDDGDLTCHSQALAACALTTSSSSDPSRTSESIGHACLQRQNGPRALSTEAASGRPHPRGGPPQESVRTALHGRDCGTDSSCDREAQFSGSWGRVVGPGRWAGSLGRVVGRGRWAGQGRWIVGRGRWAGQGRCAAHSRRRSRSQVVTMRSAGTPRRWARAAP